MSDKKYSVFISSTYTDLINIREKLMKTILKMNQFPLGMELFSAGDSAQWKVIEKTIQMTDYYVLILGHRYGSEGEDGVGYTEKEFNYAQKLEIPIISFIRNEDVPTKPSERDDEPEKKEKLRLFREKAKTGRMVEFWENENEIPEKLSIALMKQIFENPQVGWVRGNQVASTEMSNELALLLKENRELNRKLEGFKRSERKPNFELLINGKNTLNYKIGERNKSINYFEPLNKDICIEEAFPSSNSPSPFDDVDLKPRFIEEIDKYNNNILNFEKKDIANTVILSLETIQTNYINLNVTLINTGNLIGKNIACTLKFPKEILCFDSNSWKVYFEKMEKLVNEIVPHKPVLEHSGFGRELVYKKSIELNSSLTLRNNRGVKINASMDKAFLNIESLLHTRSVSLNQYITIHPLKKGTFELLVNIISEELLEPIKYTIPIVVE